MKKILIKIIVLLCCLTLVCGIAGCGSYNPTDNMLPGKRLPEYETEYFRYAVRTFRTGEREGYITGLTDLGSEQTVLIVPQEIDSVPIKGFGYQRTMNLYEGHFNSDNLKNYLYYPIIITYPVGRVI